MGSRSVLRLGFTPKPPCNRPLARESVAIPAYSEYPTPRTGFGVVKLGNMRGPACYVEKQYLWEITEAVAGVQMPIDPNDETDTNDALPAVTDPAHCDPSAETVILEVSPLPPIPPLRLRSDLATQVLYFGIILGVLASGVLFGMAYLYIFWRVKL